MKKLVLCMVSVRRREYMSDREYPIETALKQVWIGENETASYVVERHYERISDTYGTSWSVRSVDEVETIGNKEEGAERRLGIEQAGSLP